MTTLEVTPAGALAPLPLPKDVRESFVDCTEDVGLNLHILESGSQGQPLVILLHGFPELAYSWRKIMATIAYAGFYVVAPDQRGYGRTTGWDDSSYSSTDLDQFALSSYALDTISLVRALGYSEVRCVVGHDMGAAVAAACALVRPNIFTSCCLMSHPFKGGPKAPWARKKDPSPVGPDQIYRDPHIVSSLAQLDPPRKPYKWYNSEPHAASDWENPSQGMPDFLRGYFHLKSADWHRNNPHPLKAWSAPEIAKMPNYYVMPLHASMPETVEMDMEGEDYHKTEAWMSQQELSVYSQEWTRTGFQGGLNFYRVATGQLHMPEIPLFFCRKIKCPVTFISGDKDWGNFQEPGALKAMEKYCENFKGVQFVKGAGHWPQQEQPGQVASRLLKFLWSTERPEKLRSPASPAIRALPTSPRDMRVQVPRHDPRRQAEEQNTRSPAAHPTRQDTPIVGPGMRPDSQLPPRYSPGPRSPPDAGMSSPAATSASTQQQMPRRHSATNGRRSSMRNATPFEDTGGSSSDEIFSPTSR